MTEYVEVEERSGGKLRAVLLALIAALLIGMVVLGYYFLNVLNPPGTPDAGGAAGMEWVRSIYGFGPSVEEQLLGPTSVAFSPEGDIYVTDPQRARVLRFTSSGAFTGLIHTGAGGVGEGQFISPSSVSCDENGDVYISDPVANKIIVFDSSGTYLREWTSSRPLGVTAREGLVYVITNGAVSVFDPQGEPLGSFGRRGPAVGDIDAYQGVTGAGETIYVADALNHRVQAFRRNGEVLWANPDLTPDRSGASMSETETADDPETALFELPQDICFDGAGRLVVIDAFKFQIIVVSPENGEVIAAYGEHGQRDGTFFYPAGIAYDPDRDWFAVADTRNDRVQIVRIPDSGGDGQAAFARLMTSPYRYCVPPILLALLAVVVALVTRRRALSKDAQVTELDGAVSEPSGVTDDEA